MQSKYGIAAIAFFFAAQGNQPVEALRLQQKLDQLMFEQNALEEQNQAEWGFLKNIVNIDRFFASGDEPSPSRAQTVQVKDQAKIKSQVHLLAQMKSRARDAEDADESEATQTEQAEGNTEIKDESAAAPKQDENESATQQQQEAPDDQQETKAEEQAANEQTKPEAVQVDESKGAETSITEKVSASHAEQVRNEGLEIKHAKDENTKEVDLEIDEENAAAAAEEGSQTIKDKSEFQQLQEKLTKARKNPENAIGEGGFQIELHDPSEFKNKIQLVVVPNPQDLNQVTVEKFDTQDQKQSQTAAQALQLVLSSEAGATIVSDDLPQKESISKNTNSLYNSEISSGYAVRHNLVQKMAPGDHRFHTVNYQPNNEQNGYRSFSTREEGQKHFDELEGMARLLISGETGDVLMAKGTEQEIDQCLGNFYTQRYKGKYFGQN